MQSTRTCSVCFATKPEAGFRAQRRACRSCLNVQQNERRAASRETAREQGRRSYYKHHASNLERMSDYSKANRESLREKQREYTSTRRDYINARERERYANDSSGRLALNKQWRERNKEAWRAAHRIFMARRNKQISGAGISQARIHARMAAFGYRCWMCHGPFEHLDHVKPLAAGGPHLLANLRPACADCNRAKGSKWFGVNGLGAFVRRVND